MKVESGRWCSKKFEASESPTTTIAITFPSKVSATGFRVKPYINTDNGIVYPLFGDYTVKVDGVIMMENNIMTGTKTSDGWTEYAFSKRLDGAKFELIIEMSSDASHNYMCIMQLEMLIIGKD